MKSFLYFVLGFIVSLVLFNSESNTFDERYDTKISESDTIEEYIDQMFDSGHICIPHPESTQASNRRIPNPLPKRDYTVGYITDENTDPRIVAQVNKAIEIVNDSLDITLTVIDDYLQSDLPWAFIPGGSYSHLGDNILVFESFQDKNKHVTNFGWYETNQHIPGATEEYDLRMIVHEIIIHLLMGKHHGHNNPNKGHEYIRENVVADVGEAQADGVYYSMPSEFFQDTFHREDLSNYPVRPNWVKDPSKAGFVPYIMTKKEWEEAYAHFGRNKVEDEVIEPTYHHKIGDQVLYAYHSGILKPAEVINVTKRSNGTIVYSSLPYGQKTLKHAFQDRTLKPSEVEAWMKSRKELVSGSQPSYVDPEQREIDRLNEILVNLSL